MTEPLAHLSVGHSTAGQFHFQLPIPTHSPTMAEQQQEFGYHNIELYKSQTLGTGSYGGVSKAKCLQQAISAHGRNLQQLEQQVRASSGQPQQLPVTAEISQATTTAAEKDITRLRWKKEKEAPEGMGRGAAVVYGNAVCINSGGSDKVYSCQITSEGLLWFTLPDSPYMGFSLAIIDGFLTCVGGYGDGSNTNTLHSLTGEGSKRQWSKVFPPMPTACTSTASVTTEQVLVVAGGHDGRKYLDTVEVMTIATKQWSTAQHLPHPFTGISGTICGDQLYLGGGIVRYSGVGESYKSVLTCSLTDLLPPQSLGVRLRTIFLAIRPRVWWEIENLPVTRSTLTTLGGHLLAIGGWNGSHGPTADVHCYDHQTDSWHVITKMMNKRYQPLSAVLPEDQLLIVGGYDKTYTSMTSVEMGSLPVSG